MNYNTYKPHQDLDALINIYWTLEASADDNAQKQRIIPDGGVELAFILGDDIKRFTSDTEYILQPRAMVLGQITEPFYIQPTGYVNTFAVSFYPYGITNFISEPLKNLVNKETPLHLLFGEETAHELESNIIAASNTEERIKIIETFLFDKLKDKTTIKNIVKATVDTLFSTKGNLKIKEILKDDLNKRRQIERNFLKQVGISPKKLAKIIRLQTALKIMLNEDIENLTSIGYESDYYDQSHFIKDFKEFTGVLPKEFYEHENLALSSLFYK